MSDWTETTIGEVATVFDGPHATPRKTGEGPWFLSISSLEKGRLNLQESAHVSEEDFEKWTRRVTPQQDDVLFSYETRLGEAALMPGGIRACLGRRMGILRPKRNVVDPRFLLYSYLGPEFQGTIAARAVHGATVDRIPLVNLPEWPLRVPALGEQRAIVSVLAALDDKIAVNEDTARVCRELARALFRQAAMDPGGRSVALSDIAIHKPGKYLSKDAYTAGGPYPVYGSNSVMGSYTEYLYEGRFSVLARIGSNCGSTRWSESPAWVNNNASAIVPKNPADAMVLRYALETVNMSTHRAGSGQPFIRVESLMASTVAVPAPEDQGRLTARLEPLARREAAAEAENPVLAQLRDTLLVQLLSGRLRVRDAEKTIGDHV
ncbi:restriction endonuclease subunit S [Streptomyces sp. NPDC058326]|uniref:restriction endonuclease subunit S n=1 Tax=Streptomyces sp. NPDC058326 TaxID=3346447 RepID=UPI0036EB8F2D